MSFAGRTVRSSAAVRIIPRAFKGSLVCRGAIAVTKGLLWTVPDTASGSSEWIDVLFAGSRLSRGLSTLFAALESSWQNATLGTRVNRLLAVDAVTRVRTIGVIILTAVAVHTLVSVILAMPVLLLGWLVRMGLVAASMMLILRPSFFATAWKCRRDR
jgi:hypothetical protein